MDRENAPFVISDKGFMRNQTKKNVNTYSYCILELCSIPISSFYHLCSTMGPSSFQVDFCRSSHVPPSQYICEDGVSGMAKIQLK